MSFAPKSANADSGGRFHFSERSHDLEVTLGTGFGRDTPGDATDDQLDAAIVRESLGLLANLLQVRVMTERQ